jgi:hypothetical protein
MRTNKITKRTALQANVPSVAEIQNELATAESIDDFFGKEGISRRAALRHRLWARLFAGTLETMLEAELTEHLGYARRY